MAQLNSLLVTGDSRFLNTINGDITGDAGTVGGHATPASGNAGTTEVVLGNDTRLSNARPSSDVVQTYSSSSTVPISGKGVAAAIGTLDGSITGSAGAGKTLTAFSQTDGKVTATFGNISITKSQISDFPTIPSAANNGKLSIKLAGTEKASFTANQSGNSVANFTFTAGTTPSTVTKKTVVTSATFNTVVTGGTTTDVPNISKKTVVTSITPVTVVTGGTTTDIPNISKKTVVTGVTKKTVVTDATFNTVVNAVSFSNGVLSFGTGVSGSKTTGDSCTVTTGDSVTVGTAIKAYTSLTTGNSCTVSTGDSVTVGTAIKAYTTLNTGVSGSAQTGDSVTVTAGTAPSLSIASS